MRRVVRSVAVDGAVRDVEIRAVPPEVTRPLRQALLRPHQTLEELVVPGEDDPRTGWFAAFDGDEVVGCAGIMAEDHPALDTPGWRLRAMATAGSVRGTGVGRALLEACIEHAVGGGCAVVWCSARTPAAGFYQGAGFITVGGVYEHAGIGPHVDMWVDPSSSI